jgi:hypothetical protein
MAAIASRLAPVGYIRRRLARGESVGSNELQARHPKWLLNECGALSSAAVPC